MGFKPTLTKIILAVVIFILWYFWVGIYDSFWSCPLYDINLPTVNGTTPEPAPIPLVHDLDIAGKTVITAIGVIILPPLACIGGNNEIAGNIAILLLMIFSYLLSCMLITTVNKKLKKQKPK